jgi:hypothetical protein
MTIKQRYCHYYRIARLMNACLKTWDDEGFHDLCKEVLIGEVWLLLHAVNSLTYKLGVRQQDSRIYYLLSGIVRLPYELELRE